MAYTDFTSFPDSPVMFSRSTNNGTSFSTPINISGAVTSNFSQGINLQVGPSGELYAVWAIGDDWYPGEYGSDGIGFNKSLNGGASWSTPTRIFDIDGSRDWWYDKDSNPQTAVRMNDFPVMAVDRSGGVWHGNIYLGWGEKGTGGDRADIMFSKSTDGGSSWSTPKRVNNDAPTNDQWFPWIAVDPYGVINIVFYDSRSDPNNQLTEVWVAQSADGGQNFANFRVSDIAFTPVQIPGTAFGYMGDYLGITSKAGQAYPTWCDNRTSGLYQVFVDILDTYQAGLTALAHSNKSLDNNSTYSNSARHLAKGAGYLHQVFASGGEIFYRRSDHDGQSWDLTERVSESNGGNRNGCITFYRYIPAEGPQQNFLSLVWERDVGNSQYEVWYSRSDANTINWSKPLKLATVTIGNWQDGASPVISQMSYFGDKLLLVVYCSQDGLYYSTSTNFGNDWSDPDLIFSSGQVRYPSLSSGGNFVSLIYDIRPTRGSLFTDVRRCRVDFSSQSCC